MGLYVRALTYKPMSKTYEMMLSILNDIGCHTFPKVLRARDFGVPQNRERIYIIGLGKSIKTDKSFEFPELGKFKAFISFN